MSNTPINTSQPVNGRGWLGRYGAWLALGVVVIVGLGAAAYAITRNGGGDSGDHATVEVRRGPLVISVSESGTIQNRERVVVKSEVEGSTQILFLIPEGTHVKKGELLIELDSSGLAEEKTQQQILVLNSEAAYIRARENLAVMKSQAESDIAQAELKYKFAQQDLTKYTDGEYPRELQQAQANINIAEEEWQRAKDKRDWSEKLAEKKYISDSELQADELACNRAKIDLDLAKSAMDLLQNYTHQRQLDQLQSDLQQAKDALDRVKRKASADLVQAEAELRAKESEHERQKVKLTKIDDQVAKCKMTAPVDGMVVYATTGQGNWRGNAEPLEEGQQVRERQELIHLPTTTRMMAEVKVHEASLQKVSKGMPVRITVDALPGVVYWGSVRKIALLPDAQSVWLNPDLKVYSTEIVIDGDASDLRPGMTCLAEIIVQQFNDALYVPVQSVVRVQNRTVVYVPGRNGPEQREVEVGLDNNSHVRIISGLKEGDRVLQNPPLAPSTVEDQGQDPSEKKKLDVPAPTTAPDDESQSPTTQPALDLSKLRDMTPEQRRAFIESLPAEQREQLRQMRGPRGDGSRSGRSSGRQGGGDRP